jgi:uncharacterized protein YkwD
MATIAVVITVVSFVSFTLYFEEQTFQEFAGRIDTSVKDNVVTVPVAVMRVIEDTQPKIDSISSQVKKSIQEPDKSFQLEYNNYEIEKLVHQLTNEKRVLYGLEPLEYDLKISNIARGHSLDMANQNYFSHISPDGLNPNDRAELAGFICIKTVGNLVYSGIAENIFQNNLYDKTWFVGDVPTSHEWNTMEEIAQSTVDGWMDSEDHRKNILTKKFDREGIGVVISDDDKVYITQNMC